jgi:HSP20 family protein
MLDNLKTLNLRSMTMNARELAHGPSHMPIARNQIPGYRDEEIGPLLTLHREMNRLFDDVWHGWSRDYSAAAPSGFDRTMAWPTAWPSVEVAKTGKEIKVMAELPGLDEKDVRVELSNNVLTIDGEKKSETEDQNRWFNERYYGHFERRIPLDAEVDEDKVAASFRNGVLTVTLPKSARVLEHTKRISVNNGG